MRTRRKILVIDDDQSVCDLIARTLKGRGYDVFTETKYQEGIIKAEEILPDLTFISLLLDTTNGLKASRELHAVERLKKVPVIMLISYKGELDPKYTVTIGIVDVLVKPPTEKDLISKIEAAIGPGNTLDVGDIPSGAPDMYASRIDSEGQEIKVPQEDYPTKATLVADEEEVSSEEPLSVVPAEGLSADRDQTEEHDYYVPRPHPDDIEYTADENLSDDVVPEDGLLPQGAGFNTGEDISVAKEDEEIPFERPEKRGHRKKMLLAAAVVGLVAVIGVGTYMGLNFFFAAKSRMPVPPAATKGHVRVAPYARKKTAGPLPQTGAEQSSGQREIETAPLVSKRDRKRDDTAPRQSPVKEMEKQPVQESRAEAKAAKEEAAERKGVFSLQVGYFGDFKNAEASAAKMKEKGYKVTLRKEEKEGKKLYRVLVGEYKSRNEAMVQSVAILRKEGISSVPFKE